MAPKIRKATCVEVTKHGQYKIEDELGEIHWLVSWQVPVVPPVEVGSEGYVQYRITPVGCGIGLGHDQAQGSTTMLQYCYIWVLISAAVPCILYSQLHGGGYSR